MIQASVLRRPGLCALGMLVSAMLVLGAAWYQSTSAVAQPGQMTNILLLGTDGRGTITKEEKQAFRLGGIACDCSDVMMVISVSAHRNQVRVVSLPRDSYATIPAHRDPETGEHRAAHGAKINAAYREGGPALAVKTVEGMTGLKIHSHLQVDFRQFMDSVNELGGVDICTDVPLEDRNTALDLPPGLHHMAGGPSTQFVRSRHVDGSADFGRIQRQQRFLVAFMLQAFESGLLHNPVKLARVAAALLGGNGDGPGMTVGTLLDLAASLRDLRLSDLEFAVVPISGDNPPIEGIGSTLKWDAQRARQTFNALAAGQPLVTRPAAPGTQAGSTVASPQEIVPVRGDALACI
ncbi:LCP family protein [Streptomyces sp. NPDC087297]|uniref:LCP family protein n=1 Tax=Streptomyces sp. NPDC087297 TaxID=3365778 RepID=UPI00380AC4A5